jgi:CHAD domain-containing protein
MSKQVKRVRKAGGAARDLDVLRIRWSGRNEHMPSGPVALLLEQVQHCRREAQLPIEEVYGKLVEKRFVRRTSRFLKRVRTQDGQLSDRKPFGCMARAALGRVVVPYLAAARAEMGDAEALHAFRIQGKQVRYAMEIFAGAFNAEFRDELYPVVATLQDRLGAINDHVTAQTYLASWLDQVDSCALREALEIGMQRERHWFDSSRQEFLAWWNSERREDLRQRFARYVQVESPHEQPSHFENYG